MLPACVICKKRKKKCDFLLPSCKNCEVMGTQCEFYDEGLGNNVPREYLKSLSDNITFLKSEIEKFKKKIDKRESFQESSSDSKSKLYEVVKNGTFIESFDSTLNYFGPCSLVSIAYMSYNMLHLKSTSFDQILAMDLRPLPSLNIPFDYSLITSEHCKLLISDYLTEIFPKYPLLSENFFHFDLMVKNYPESKQIFLLLILLVSSANLMRKRSDFVPIKIMLQRKVAELMRTKVFTDDTDSLVCFIYYAIYELLDPENENSVRHSLSLACNIAESIHLGNGEFQMRFSGSITKHISKNVLLNVLLTLDCEISFVLGKLPLQIVSKKQIMALEDDGIRANILEIYEKGKFYALLYDNSTNCKLADIFCSQMFKSDQSDLWLIASPLLCHTCSYCSMYYDSLVLNILGSSISTLKKYKKRNRKAAIMFYWIAVSKIAISVVNLVLIKKKYQSCYYGIVSEESINEHITIGKNMIDQISSQWYHAGSISVFIEEISKQS